MQKLNIGSLEDIRRIQQAIINKEDFEIGEVKSLTYTIKLDGGRFKDYDINYIDANVAEIVLSYQKSYTKLLNELERKFKIQFDEKDYELKFKLEEGSLDLVGTALLKGVENMNSEHTLYAVLGVAAAFLLGYGAKQYFNSEKEVNKAINTPKQAIIKVLDDDEKASIGDVEITKQDSEKYESEFQAEDEVINIKTQATVKGFEKKPYGWQMKLTILSNDLKEKHGINKKTFVADSKLEPKDNMDMFRYADNADTINLHLSLVANTGAIKEAYITKVSKD